MKSDAEIGLGTMLRRVMLELDGGTQQVYDRRAATFRPRYFPIARQLLDRGATPVSELSDRLGMTQPAVSQTLKEMDRDGLISLEAGKDRRVRLVRFTEKGKALCGELEPVWAAVDQSADEIGAEVGADLRELLDLLLAALERKSFACRIEEKLA